MDRYSCDHSSSYVSALTHLVVPGPYATAILKLQISFPSQYPTRPPLVTLQTDIFHPLVVPLTTYTFSTGAVGGDQSTSAGTEEALPSGTFSLRHGFPEWVAQAREKSSSQGKSHAGSRLSAEFTVEAPAVINKDATHSGQPSASVSAPIQEVLAYLKSAFEDANLLDALPIKEAVNPGAWHAWRSYRGLPKVRSGTTSPESDSAPSTTITHKQPSDWNWEGVWEKRASTGIENSMSEATLFGKAQETSHGQNAIRFQKLDEEQIETVRREALSW